MLLERIEEGLREVVCLDCKHGMGGIRVRTKSGGSVDGCHDKSSVRACTKPN